MVHANSGDAQFIKAYHGCYDPLACPLFYPGGETSWEDKKILLEEIPVVHFPRKRRKYTKHKKPDTNVGLLKDKSQSSCTRVETTQVDRYKRMSSRIVGGGAKQGSILDGQK
ncbi:hypothetical protein SETIT_9G481300v2, partial [Setaria italica]